MKKKQLVIYGAGETALLAYEYFTYDSEYKVAAFTVDAAYKKEDVICGLPVIAFEQIERSYPSATYEIFVASGSGKLNRVRADLYKKAKDKGYKCASYISSRAFVWHNVEVGENCFVLEDNTLQPFTKIGNNVVMWSGNHLGHRSVVGDHCFVTSHVVISGYCTIGAYSFVGVNAAFADNVTVAEDNFIAMGTVVQKNTEPNSIYMGNPAQKRDIAAKKFCKVVEAS